MGEKSKGSRTDTIIKLILIFFVSLLSFTVGTLTGKKVSDLEYKKTALNAEFKIFGHSDSKNHAQSEHKMSETKLDAIAEDFINKERSHDEHTEKTDHASKSHSPKKDGYKKIEHKSAHSEKQNGQKNKLKHVASHTEKHTEKHAKKHVTEHTKKHDTTKNHASHKDPIHHTSLTPSKESTDVAHGDVPTKNIKMKRKPTSVMPTTVATSAIGKYTVQIASYSTEDEAKNHASTLKEKGFSAFYVPAHIKGKNWYRVSVGLFSTYKSAIDFQKKLKVQAKIPTSIIQKIVK